MCPAVTQDGCPLHALTNVVTCWDLQLSRAVIQHLCTTRLVTYIEQAKPSISWLDCPPTSQQAFQAHSYRGPLTIEATSRDLS